MPLRHLPLLASLALILTLGGTLAAQPAERTDVPTIRVIKHSVWSPVPVKGIPADGIRRNLADGESFQFKDVTIKLVKTTPAGTQQGAKDRVEFQIGNGTTTDTKTLDESAAFTWNGYYVAIVAVHAKQGELGYPLTAFEIATIESIPAELAQKTTANGAAQRLRIPHTINRLTLHHSAVVLNDGDDLAEKLVGMQKWGETDRNWWDIPYHFMIDRDGTVFEARDYRYVGDTNTRYNPSGHFLVNCYGNFETQVPNEAQIATIVNLFAWAAVEFDLDPITIYGHKDLAETACPGKNLYKLLQDGTIARRVEEVRAKGQPKMVWLDAMPEKNSWGM